MTTGTTTSTRTAAFFGRYGRLLALCGVSLLLHAAAIAWLDMRIAPEPPPSAQAGLAVRLAEAPAATPTAPALPAPAPVPDAPAPLEEPAPPAPVTRLAPASSAAPPSAVGVAEPQTPSRYRVSMPPPVTLLYEVRDATGPAGAARLRWDTDGVQYKLVLEGILGDIASEGGTDDAGISPQRASYRLGTGSAAVAFERERRTIVFEAFGRSAQDQPGSQDGATVLMQLAGIGLADPDQLQEAVDIYVGRADGAAVERYQVVGRERIETPLGALDTLHLQRKGGLDVWLAPERGWLPVQLRAGGRTQVVKEFRGNP